MKLARRYRSEVKTIVTRALHHRTMDSDESEADKLRAELRRFRNLHSWTTAKEAREALTRLIADAEERLRKIENPDA